MIRYLLPLATVFLLYSCSAKEEKGTSISDPVSFYSEIEQDTRVIGTAWEDRDQVGIFMLADGSQPTNEAIIGGGNNRFSTDGSGLFTAVTENDKLFFPDKDNYYSIIAYYPYSSTITDLLIPIDLSDQSDQTNLDILYSNNLSGIRAESFNKLLFQRKTSRLILNIYPGRNVGSLTGISVASTGLSKTGSLDLTDGNITISGSETDNIDFYITHENGMAQAVATVIPGLYVNEIKVRIKLSNDDSFIWTIPANTTLEAGSRYVYNITLNDNDSQVAPTYSWVETPAVKSIENTLFIARNLPDKEGRNFSMLYDTRYKIAYWVAYPMHGMYLGSTKRTNAWAYDPLVDNIYQANLSSSYVGTENSRGHQLPSADRTYSVAGNKTTFYYTNMTPQNDKLNSGMWGTLEDKVRTWTSQCDTLYVVTGAAITTNTDQTIEYAMDKSGNEIARPKFFYKALAKRTGNTFYTIAYKFDNQVPSGTLDSHRLSVKELENETGFTFFPELPDNIKDNYDTSQWR